MVDAFITDFLWWKNVLVQGSVALGRNSGSPPVVLNIPPPRSSRSFEAHAIPPSGISLASGC